MKKLDRNFAIYLAILLGCLIGLFVELISAENLSPIDLSRYSTGILALLLVDAIALCIVTAIAIWWLSSPSAKHDQVLNRAKSFLHKDNLIYQIAIYLVFIITMFALWNFYPYSRTSLRLITVVLLLLFALYSFISPPQVPSTWENFFGNLTALTWSLGIFISLHLIAGTLLVSTNGDEAAQVYTQVQLMHGNYKPYVPGGLQMAYAPLAYYIPGAFLRIFGPHLLVSRLVSAAAGIAIVPLMVSIANHEAKNKYGGIFALALLVLSFSTLSGYSIAFNYSQTSLFLLLAIRVTQIMKKGWKRVALGLIFAGLATLVRHTMIVAPLVFLAYFIFTEKPHHLLIGTLIAGVVGIALLAPFWPSIISLVGPVFPLLNLVYPGAGTDIVAMLPDSSLPRLGAELRHVYIMISSHFPVFAGALLAGYLLIKQKHTDLFRKEKLRQNQILILVIALGLVSFGFQFYLSLTESVCQACIHIYLDYFWPVCMIAVAIIIARLLPLDDIPPRQNYLGLIMLIAMFLVANGHRTISVWRYTWPSAPLEADKMGKQVAAYLDEDDKIFYFGFYYPLIPLVENQVFPQTDYYYSNYLPPEYDMPRETMAIIDKYNDEMVDEWLNDEADIVILTEAGLSIMSTHYSLIETINSNLEENFHLVDEFSTSDTLPIGDILIYRRNDANNGN